MHVLLAHGYFLREDPKEQVIMRPYPPLGILYLSAWLERHGVENEVFDSTFSSREALESRLLAAPPRILAIYANLMTKRNVIRLMRFARSQPTLADTLIVLGGPDVTHNLDGYLGAGADVLVIGEGEQTMLEIALTVDGGRWDGRRWPVGEGASLDFRHVPGVAFRLPDGSIFKTEPRQKLRSLDELPMPNRLKINLQEYLDAWKTAHGQRAISVSTQRGCPYTCRWCSTAVYGQSYRRRSPQAVCDEIEWLQKNYDFDLIWFVDDVFTVSHRWLEEFSNVLKIRGLRVQFECITRADRLTHEVVKLLRACGCFRVWIGAESGSQRIIDAMDRRVDVRQVRDMIRAARSEGIEAGTFIMLGYPGETEADIRQTVEHLKASNPDLFTITLAYPIRGTGLFEEVAADLRGAPDWAESTDRDLDFRRTYPRQYYDYALRWTVNAVHLHKAHLAGKSWRPAALRLRAKIAAARAGMCGWKIFGKIAAAFGASAV